MSNKLEYQDLLGKPFKLGGRGPEHYDCWGICLELGRRAGIELPVDFTPEETEKQDEVLREYRDSEFIKLDKPEPYCIVTFYITPPFVDHCGFVLEDGRKFIHIMKDRSVSVCRLDHKILKNRIEGFYRYAGGKDIQPVSASK